MTSPGSEVNDNVHEDAPQSGADDDTRKKFLEALENKKNQQHGTAGAVNGAKISHSHGSASHKREFRRKSG
ncbi:DUF5302 domain-containing protein [Specibacter cremeus]|uniref:DUF5302 domain-containing protein n=1 Tax=Specibacter cremeus TaxID=1629051 RepID=UPI000F7B3B92|nr:DUF5302 domain-containing protein [Specibacter cremeus]